jgi:hypothetical protein
VSSIDKFTLALRGTGDADGELTFAALHRITGAMQQLATRIGRNLTGQEGLAGRPGPSSGPRV